MITRTILKNVIGFEAQTLITTPPEICLTHQASGPSQPSKASQTISKNNDEDNIDALRNVIQKAVPQPQPDFSFFSSAAGGAEAMPQRVSCLIQEDFFPARYG